MELFTIHCTTCKARLVVKDESLIGDILACPKCQSMVQVVPPVDWKRPGADESSPGELPAVAAASAEPEAPVAEEPAVASSPSEEPSTEKAAAGLPPAIPPALPTRPAATSPAPEPTPAATPTEPSAAPSLLAAALAWARRDWIVLAGGLTGGVTLGAVVWLAVTFGSSTPEPAKVADGQTAEASLNDETEGASSTQPAPEPAEQPTAAAAELTPPAAEPAVATTKPEQVAAAEPPEVPQTTADEQQSAPIVKPGEAADAAPPERGPSLRLDPIRASGPTSDLVGAITSAGSAPPRELPPEKPLPSEAESASVPSADQPATLSRDEIKSRLAVSLDGVEFSKVPLAQFTTFVADVSRVPIELDRATLAEADGPRNTPISIQLAKTTAGKALRAAVQQAGLAVAIRDGRIVIFQPSE